MHQMLESFFVVAASVKAQIDGELVRMLLIDQFEKAFRVRTQVFVTAKTAVNGVEIGQIGVPELFVQSLPK